MSNIQAQKVSSLTSLILEIFRIDRALITFGDRLNEDLGVTSGKWKVMGAIKILQSRVTVPLIADEMGLTRQSVQKIVNDLVKEDLLEKEENPINKRSKYIALTKKGLKILYQIDKRQIKWASSIVTTLRKKDIVQACHLLQKFCHSIEKSEIT